MPVKVKTEGFPVRPDQRAAARASVAKMAWARSSFPRRRLRVGERDVRQVVLEPAAAKPAVGWPPVADDEDALLVPRRWASRVAGDQPHLVSSLDESVRQLGDDPLSPHDEPPARTPARGAQCADCRRAGPPPLRSPIEAPSAHDPSRTQLSSGPAAASAVVLGAYDPVFGCQRQRRPQEACRSQRARSRPRA